MRQSDIIAARQKTYSKTRPLAQFRGCMNSDFSESFALGTQVTIGTDRASRGAVVGGPRSVGESGEYQVLINGEVGWFSGHLLKHFNDEVIPRWVPRDELLRELALAKLRYRLTDTLLSYRASRTFFASYQYRPVLKFLNNPKQRILIADEVGLGKTIEAALIYLELKSRLEINRVIVMCPSRLSEKWRSELASRFDEHFSVFDSKQVRKLMDDTTRYGESLAIRAIVPYETLRRDEFLNLLSERALPLDLLIVDEAHYMRNENTKTYRVGETLVQSADAVVFLTATPLHLRSRDLFNLLGMLAPEDFPDANNFDDLVAPNRFITAANRLVANDDYCSALDTLQETEETTQRLRFLNSPSYQMTVDILREYCDHPQSRSLAERIELQKQILEQNTLSSIFSRTRKREIAEAAVRAPFSIKVPFTKQEQNLYDKVLSNAGDSLSNSKSRSIGFGAIMQERQAASCLPALAQKISESGWDTKYLADDVEVSEFTAINNGETAELEESSRRFDVLTEAEPAKECDSKFEKLIEVLSGAFTDTPNSKVLLFSFFKSTLKYLEARLTVAGYKVLMISGDVPIQQRFARIDQFRQDSSVQLMLSSEVGAEGLDFQFCDILVNYDLPWNPMQLEQRIGRLDRFGQEHKRIRIYNFIIEGTIESRILERLYERIQLFQHAIGDLEAMLGEQIARITESAIQGSLTDAEVVTQLDQLAERVERLRQEEFDFESNRDQLMSHEQIFDEVIQDTISSGRFVSGDEVRALVTTHLRTEFGATKIEFDYEEPCATLELGADHARALQQYLVSHRLTHNISDSLRQLLGGSVARLPITFDSELARRRQRLEFISSSHPLTRMAVEYWQNSRIPGVPSSSVQVVGKSSEAGSGYFYVYLMTVRGVNESVVLESIVVLDDGRIAFESAKNLLSDIQDSAPFPRVLDHDTEDFIRLEELASRRMFELRQNREASLRQKNESLIASRLASTQASFDAKFQRIEAVLRAAEDPRIRRMKVSQLENQKARLQIKLDEINSAREITISSRLIAGGRVSIIAGAAESVES